MNLRVLNVTAILLALPLSNIQASGFEKSELTGGGWERIIGSPPEPGTYEEEQDVAVLLEYQNTRTKAECEAAAKQSKMSLKGFFGGANGPLSDKEVKKNWFFWYKYVALGGLPSLLAKNHFKRPRPFKTFPQIEPCINRPGSASFPSGHTSTAFVMARALSLKYPERAALFMRSAEEVAKNRMLGGVHYPSDIAAGKELADYIADRLLSDKKALEDLYND